MFKKDSQRTDATQRTCFRIKVQSDSISTEQAIPVMKPNLEGQVWNGQTFAKMRNIMGVKNFSPVL